MTLRPLLLSLTLVLAPVAIDAQDVPATTASTQRLTTLPSIDSVGHAAAAAVVAANGLRAERREEGRGWVRTAKWTLLAAAAGFGAYALANSRTEHTDRRAQVGILGGQLSLLGSVGLFIYDLRRDHETPADIPFEQPPTNSGGSPSGSHP